MKRKIIAIRMFITTAILFILSIGLSIGKKYLKKCADSKKEVKPLDENNEIIEKTEEENEVG